MTKTLGKGHRALAAAAVLTAVTSCSVQAGHVSSSTSQGTSQDTAQKAAQGAGINVPMKVVSKGRSTLEVVPVYVNGHGPYDFMLDTGSAMSSISRDLATKLHLKKTGTTKQIRGVATTTKIPLVHVPGWKLGSARLTPETIGEVDLSKTGGGSIGGLLGSDELKRFGTVTLDFPAGRLRLGHAQR